MKKLFSLIVIALACFISVGCNPGVEEPCNCCENCTCGENCQCEEGHCCCEGCNCCKEEE